MTWHPRHVVSVGRSFWTVSEELFKVGCSCGWAGPEYVRLEGEDEDEAIEGCARSWREHVRLSEQVSRRSKKYRQAPAEQGLIVEVGL